MSQQRAGSPRPVSTVSTTAAGPSASRSNYATAPSIEGSAYLEALAQFIRRHEAALADYNAPRPKISPAPSWTTVLTLGIVPTADPSTSSNGRRSPAPPPPPRKEPLVLRFDPHHLYYLLLKFDEIDLPSSGDLDVRVEGGTTRPMMVDYSAMSASSATTTPGLSPGDSQGKDADGASLFGSMFGRPRADDTRSIQSGMSSFSFGSGWWGLGSKQPQQVDEAATVRYIYSSCTKLPALRLSPFQLSPPAQSGSSSSRNSSGLSPIVQGFEDCPPPATCVPLLAFKNLSSLTLEDLDPRGFLGWDVLSVQLRSLSVHRGGIEDIGELICDAPCEDLARREQEERRNKPVGTERKRRAEGVMQSSLMLEPRDDDGAGEDGRPSSSASVAAYPTPPRLAWSSLRHLSLADNSLTFVPSPPLAFLPTLTSLDLSSNLLITIPPGLAYLTSLRSLNLSDNMIDSLLGISKALGAIEVLNLSQNRLENLSGLDRLPALERLDLRSNAVYDVLEVSRLARLPHLRELWLAENPLTASRLEGGDDKWRVKCFGYFAEEEALGHRDLDADAGQVRIDGRIMTSSERRVLEAEYLSRQGRPLGLGRRKASHDVLRGGDRPADERNGQQAKVVGRRVVTAPHRHARAPSPPPPPLPSASLPADTADTASINTASADERSRKAAVKPKRRKPQRIVDLDGPDPRNPASRELANDGTTGSDQAGARDVNAESDSGPTPSSSKQRPSSTGARRERMPSALGETAADSSSSEAGSGEAFRRKIEALRNEVGESWLSVLAEREAREERERKERERAVTAPASEAAPAPVASSSIASAAVTASNPQTNLPPDTPSKAPDPTVLEATEEEPAGAKSVVEDEKPGDSQGAEPRPGLSIAEVAQQSATIATPTADQERGPEEEQEEAVAAGPTAVPTTVKSVRKKRGKGKKKGGR